MLKFLHTATKLSKMNFLIVLLPCVALGVSEKPDYCSSEYKGYCGQMGGVHIGCEASSEFGSDCPEDAELYKEDDIKDDFTYFHNYYRNKVALGEIPSYDSAKRMTSLIWDKELAQIAELNVKACVFKHDRCRSTNIYRQPGQNIAAQGVAIAEPMLDIKELSNNTVLMWFNEYKDGGKADMEYLTLDRLLVFGHFTQMAVDRLTAVGCAMIKYTNQDNKNAFQVYVACNYGITHMYDKPVYDAGEAASECQTGPNPDFPGLCSTAEIFEPNWW